MIDETTEAGPAARLDRSIGLWGATGIGVGAIVGGGILALAGVAFAVTGPSAMLAFALNGAIAALTAISFAELASTFPESGGPYTFAKKIVSAEAAFMVGWVVWLASIVAAVLYALGFAAYASLAVTELLASAGRTAPLWLSGRAALLALAAAATAGYTVQLGRTAGGGGQWPTVGKVIVFVVLIAGGVWALTRQPAATSVEHLRPFFAGGPLGLLQAMGFTFIALQGFDLIAAVGGEVKNPRRTIPRAMFLSLGTALAIYLPLLLLITVVGVAPGESITARSAEDPATVVAAAARNYLGTFGFWLVVVAALLSMLSALQANLLAASRVALTMARDRSLPHQLSRLHSAHGTPLVAVQATGLLVVIVLILVPDLAAAGAVSSLIFLISFALAHVVALLMRVRTRGAVSEAFRAPAFPAVPLVGGIACGSLAVYQGLVVPSAGVIALLWLAIGLGLYFFLFARRAGVVDASAEGLDPELLHLRGRSPLVLAPIANPASAAPIVELASKLAPPRGGRVLLHSVVQPPGGWERGGIESQLADVGAVLGHSIMTSLDAGITPEWLTTVAPEPWQEIARVARSERCETVLVGLGTLAKDEINERLGRLINTVDANVVILRAPAGWSLRECRNVLVPVGGRRDQSLLRARLIASLTRDSGPSVTYLRVVREATRSQRRQLEALVQDETAGAARAELTASDQPADDLLRACREADLAVLGLQRRGRERTFGGLTLRIAAETSTPLILISRR